MKFEEFHYIDIRELVSRRGLIFSNWIQFHISTEMKTRAALYHLERSELLNGEYQGAQEFPEAQSISNLHHPLKEAVFFEFNAAITSLLAAIDSLLQEINSACRLKLSPTRIDGKPYVTLRTVTSRLGSEPQLQPVRAMLRTLEDQEPNSWYKFLQDIRNVSLHADAYMHLREERNVGKIFARLKELQESGGPGPVHLNREIRKRDIFLRFQGEDYEIVYLCHRLSQIVREYIAEVHQHLIDSTRSQAARGDRAC